MSCKHCKNDSNYHSFEFLGRTKINDAIYYTRVSKAKEYKINEDTIIDYIDHMDSASMSAWVWIFDCRGLEALHMPSLNILRKFTELVQERYKFVLKHIYILYPNWKMNIMLSMIQPFLKEETRKRLVICDTPLQVFETGISNDNAKHLLK